MPEVGPFDHGWKFKLRHDPPRRRCTALPWASPLRPSPLRSWALQIILQSRVVALRHASTRGFTCLGRD